MVLVLIFWIFDSEDEPDPELNQIGAELACEDWISEQLKSPSSADYLFGATSSIGDISDQSQGIVRESVGIALLTLLWFLMATRCGEIHQVIWNRLVRHRDFPVPPVRVGDVAVIRLTT